MGGLSIGRDGRTSSTAPERRPASSLARALRLCLLSLLALLVAPVAAHAATVTVANGTIRYDAAAGETNTAVVVEQQTTPVATVYFVGDQNPAVTVTASAAQGCLPTPPARLRVGRPGRPPRSRCPWRAGS